MLKDARETVEGFVKGWLVEPLKEVLKTVRAGGAEGEVGVIVSKEGVIADLEVSFILCSLRFLLLLMFRLLIVVGTHDAFACSRRVAI
jgi:hypothetical protein